MSQASHFENLKPFLKKYEWHLIVALMAVIIAFQVLFNLDSDKKHLPPDATVELDTIIPDGHSLFPLNLVNNASISAVLGPFGVVDLYRYYGEEHKKIMISNIKIFRAPRDPNSFYALVKNEYAKIFISNNNPVFAVIKNRTNHKSHIQNNKKIFKRRITIGSQ